MMKNRYDLSETEIHNILRNSRRHKTLQYLGTNGGKTTIRDLSEYVAAEETGESPPPRDVRKAVYVSLHQTHLPMLDDKGVIEYNRSNNEVTLLDSARDIQPYIEVVTKYGITWEEFYRNLGIVALVIIIASSVGVPVVSWSDPALWSGLFLALFVVSVAYRVGTTRLPLSRKPLP